MKSKSKMREVKYLNQIQVYCVGKIQAIVSFESIVSEILCFLSPNGKVILARSICRYFGIELLLMLGQGENSLSEVGVVFFDMAWYSCVEGWISGKSQMEDRKSRVSNSMGILKLDGATPSFYMKTLVPLTSWVPS